MYNIRPLPPFQVIIADVSGYSRQRAQGTAKGLRHRQQINLRTNKNRLTRVWRLGYRSLSGHSLVMKSMGVSRQLESYKVESGALGGFRCLMERQIPVEEEVALQTRAFLINWVGVSIVRAGLVP